MKVQRALSISNRTAFQTRSINRIALATLASLIVGVTTTNSNAQEDCPASWLLSIGLPGTTSSVICVATLPDGDVLASGSFSSAGLVPGTALLARYNVATNTWTGTGINSNGAPTSMLVLPEGDVLIGGGFTMAGGIAANGIVKYKPTTGEWFPLGATSGSGNGVAGVATSVVVLNNGDWLVAGGFTNAGGLDTASPNIARYSPHTNSWSRVAGPNSTVNAMGVLPNGDVVVGGVFSMVGGVPGTSRVALFHPDTNTWSALGLGVNGTVYTLLVVGGGDVLLGGGFTMANGVAASRVVRVNPTTGVWTTLGAGASNLVLTMALLPDGDVIMGGRFNNIGVVTGANRVALFDPDTNTWSGLGGGLGTSGDVNSVTVLPNSDLVFGGGFPRVAGELCNYIVGYTFGGCDECPPCAADFDQDGGITGSDIEAFFIAFEAGAPCGDTDLDGGITGSDVEEFFRVFEAGGC